MLMTKLGGTVGYCEVRLGGQRRHLVIVAGHPMEFRSFCQLAAVLISGCIIYNHAIEAEILNLWDELGYQELNQIAPMVEVQVSYDDWEFTPGPRKNFYHLLNLLKNSQGEYTTTTDFRPMLAEIGRRHTEAMLSRE